jgi:probable selenium-dependent hydroxylase accessory protein YqeC
LAEYPKIAATRGKGVAPGKTVSLMEAFGIHPGEVISLVGAGGKSALMLALAEELVVCGEMVITTTTTRIFDWQASETCLILRADEKKMLELVRQELGKHRLVTLAGDRLPAEGKLKGIGPELVADLAQLEGLGCIIIEADGAARKPLKAPNATEPVIPQNTSLVIPVVGIDALGLRLSEENVFRPQIVSQLTSLPPGGIISANVIATLITHPQGMTKGSPARARIVPFINKTDLEGGLARACDLAARILARGHPRIRRVVLGQVQPEPLVRVVQDT